MADVFISYSRKDVDFMQQTRDYLRNAGLTVWTDESLTPGTPAWTRAIEQAIRAARLMVVVLSPDAKDSDWVERELAVGQDFCHIPIFPILLRGDEHTAIHFRLAVTQFADARLDVDMALTRLTMSIKIYLSHSVTNSLIAPPSTSVTLGEPTVVVAKVGAADFRTIGTALEHVAEGTTIIVRQGLYRECLIINKPVVIVGEGKREEIILESNSINCIKMDTDYAEVRGLTIRLQVGISDNKYFAVDITKGRLILESCDITSDSWAVVGIHGKGVDPILRNCTIHDSKSAGIFIHEDSVGLIEDCEIFSNALAGIEIKTHANPIIRHCAIHNSRVGLLIWENGTGLIEDCEIFTNAYSGVEIRTGGNPTVHHCKINRNAYQGIYAHDKGRGIIEDCDLRENIVRTWLIRDRCVVERRNNQE